MAAIAVHPAPPAPGTRGWAGIVLTRVPVILAAAVAAVCLVAVPLVLLQLWRPVVAVPVVVVVAVLAGRLAAGTPVVPTRAFSALTCAGIAVAGGVWAGLTHAEQVVLRRDAGSLALFGHHLSTAHGLAVDPSLAALGGAAALADPNLTLASPAFYQVGERVIPQFLLGAPALFSLGDWAGGWPGMFLVPPVLGAMAILSVAGLAARLLGARWAPLAAGSFALSQPVLHADRSTYSEPPALLILAAAASLLIAATAAPLVAAPAAHVRRTAARLGGGAGLLMGACGLVRIDFLREVALLLPVIAVLLARRHPAGRALLAGSAASTVLAAGSAVATSRPYLASIAGSLLPLLAVLVALSAISYLALRLARTGWLARRPVLASPRLGPVLAVVLAIALIGLASRPLWLIVRQDPRDPGSKLVAGLQLSQRLAVDGGRTYAEHSLDWVSWYLGWPVLILAGVAAVALLVRLVPAVQGRAPLPAWTAPFVVSLGSTLLTLYRPGITPDHPWADRRFVPLVLPAVVLLATAAVAFGVRELPGWIGRVLPGRQGTVHSRAVPATLGVLGAVLLLLPPAIATAPVAGQRTERGEPVAVAAACSSFRPGDVALAVDPRSRNEWPQALRGTCGIPTASVVVASAVGAVGSARYTGALRAAVTREAVRIRAAGGRPVLVAAGGVLSARDTLAGLGATGIRQISSLRTAEDQRLLTRRPDGAEYIDVDVWTGVPG